VLRRNYILLINKVQTSFQLFSDHNKMDNVPTTSGTGTGKGKAKRVEKVRLNNFRVVINNSINQQGSTNNNSRTQRPPTSSPPSPTPTYGEMKVKLSSAPTKHKWKVATNETPSPSDNSTAVVQYDDETLTIAAFHRPPATEQVADLRID
jgi:hypothetical protein